jgi:hypothetical protein
MKNLFFVTLILVYIILSAFLESGPEESRITVADITLVGLMALALFSVLSEGRPVFPAVHLAAIPMFCVFAIGVFSARYPERAALELFIILFSFCGSMAMINMLVKMPKKWLTRFVSGYVLVIGVLSLICLIDFLVIPGLISSRSLGGLQGPFRNTGQAGSFFSVHFALILAIMVSRVIPRRLVYLLCTSFVFSALIFTLKRASIISFVIGVFMFAVFLIFSNSPRERKVGYVFVAIASMAASIVYFVFIWGLENIPGLQWRLDYKFSIDALDTFSEGGLINENFYASMMAFYDMPIWGVGLDNVRGVYQFHEVHSTYLGILAYGGLLGVVGYCFFMAMLLKTIWIEGRHKLDNAWSAFLYMLLPLFIGQFFGWAYTYHIRKREFWLLVVFVVVAAQVSQRLRQAQTVRVRSAPPISMGYGHGYSKATRGNLSVDANRASESNGQRAGLSIPAPAFRRGFLRGFRERPHPRDLGHRTAP